MMNEVFDGRLQRSSLGRQGFIGELYDARNESLTSRALLKSPFPQNLIECRNVDRMEIDYEFTESISDRFELMKVEGALQLGVILGAVTLEGSGKFLTDEKKSEKTVSCSMLCQFQTVNEKFFASFDEILQYVDLTALEESQYTHVIVEMTWGANCVLNIEGTYQSDSEKKKKEGALDSKLKLLQKWLDSIKVKGKFEKKKADSINKKDFNIKIYADVMPDKGWPTSIEDFCYFVKDFQELLKNVNNGKGKPLNYVMIPLDRIRKLAKLDCRIDVEVRKIDESFLLSTILFFEEITKTKQKLNDLILEMSENKKYVTVEKLSNVRKQYEDLCIKESKLKALISNDWASVRTGEKTLKDLIKKIEKFKNHNLNLFTYEGFIESYSSTLNKISTVKNYISKGVIYLGREEKLQDVMSNNLSCEFIVLVISTEIEKADPELYKNTCYYFLTLATESKPNTKYVVIDFDYNNTEEQRFLNKEITRAKCFHLKGNKVLSSDLYGDYLVDSESDFAQLGQGYVAEYDEQKPGNRVMLKIPCPGFEMGSCPPNLLTWNCTRCKNSLEYGFNDYFYCLCGRGLAASYEYRCANPKHGSFFVTPTSEFLKNALSNLRPLKELNVLLLGQSGVGKSTWINSIVNYLTYESIDTAKEMGVICTIPAKVTAYDLKAFTKHVGQIGEETKDEKMEVGESATQKCHTYHFHWEDRFVRIIDTPGLGDTRGIQQDKENLKNIIDHIGHFKDLHGVCILFKACENRLTPMFEYCIKELLSHLHKSVTKNIVFCFTNARNAFYSPGLTPSFLEKLIKRFELQELSLGEHNMFCLENEAFLFLCSLEKFEIQFEPTLIQSFSRSWEKSLQETIRLFKTIKSFKPHLLKETISLVTARNRILTLTKPIAEISKTIQINVAAIERKKEEINAAQLTIEELSKKLNFTEIHLEPVPLDHPRTVCTSSSCVEYFTYRSIDVSEIEYKTHCHDKCKVENVIPKTVNNALLKNCLAMNSNGTCQKCGCQWENHMHLTYSQKRVEKTAVNKNIEKNLMKEKSAKEEIESFVENLKSTVEKYKQEQEFIIQASVRFGMFLKKNAISFYNDSVAENLEYLIKVEEGKPLKSNTEKRLLQNLKEMLDYYNSEVRILQDIIKKGNGTAEELTAQEVYELEKKLYELELTGKAIKDSVRLSRSSNQKMSYYAETPLQITKPRQTQKKLATRVFQKISNFVHQVFNEYS